MFVRAMIGRSGCRPGTLPRTVSYSSTRVLHHNRPQRRPRPPALAPNELATNFFDDKSLQEHREAFLSATGDTDVTGDSEEPEAGHRRQAMSRTPGGDNENTLSSFPSRIGNQLCFADLTPNKKTWRIHRQPRRSSQSVRRMRRQ